MSASGPPPGNGSTQSRARANLGQMNPRNEAGAATEMDERDWALLVLLSILWGGSFFFTGVAIRELPPLTIVLARVTIAAALLLPLLLAHGGTLPANLTGWMPFFGMGLLNNITPFSLIVCGQARIASGVASVLT
jgi:drug/metabolite transporter (DMT)-like permease